MLAGAKAIDTDTVCAITPAGLISRTAAHTNNSIARNHGAPSCDGAAVNDLNIIFSGRRLMAPN
jgi:hypothetical protein